MRSPLFRAVLEQLNTEFDVELADNRLITGARPEGRPIPANAEFFVVLHGINWFKPDDVPDSQVTAYTVDFGITVTQRTSNIGFTDLQELYLPDAKVLSIDQVCTRVISVLGNPNNYEIVAKANADPELLLGGREEPIGEYYEVYQFSFGDPDPIPVRADWFKNDPEINSPEMVGVRQTMRFTGAKFAIIQRCDGSGGF